MPSQSDRPLFLIGVAFLIAAWLVFIWFVTKTAKSMQALQAQAAVLQVQLSSMETQLTNRFAYITSDFDATKAQVRELNKSVDRLNGNGLKLIGYLENRDKPKNAGRR